MIVIVVVVLIELLKIILWSITFYKIRKLENDYLWDFLGRILLEACDCSNCMRTYARSFVK